MTSEQRVYPDPSTNLETEAYWAGCKEGHLKLKKCGDCNKVHYYPRLYCPHCQSANTDWINASGRGKIYSYSVMRRTEVPFAIAYVTLDEGVTMMTNIVECDLDNLAIGQDVEVTFHQTEGGYALPVFRPIS